MKDMYFSVTEFADRLNVHPNTVRRAIRVGRIHAIRLGSGKRGVFRIPSTEIERLILCDIEAYIDKLVTSRLDKSASPATD